MASVAEPWQGKAVITVKQMLPLSARIYDRANLLLADLNEDYAGIP